MLDCLHGYLALKKHPQKENPTVGICLGPHGGPKGSAVFYERGTPRVVEGGGGHPQVSKSI